MLSYSIFISASWVQIPRLNPIHLLRVNNHLKMLNNNVYMKDLFFYDCC